MYHYLTVWMKWSEINEMYAQQTFWTVGLIFQKSWSDWCFFRPIANMLENLLYNSTCFQAEIVETLFVISRFSDIRKDTTSFLVISKRNNQKWPSFSVVSARNWLLGFVLGLVFRVRFSKPSEVKKNVTLKKEP